MCLVAAGLHLAQEEEPEGEQESEGRDGDQQAEPLILALILDGDVDAVIAQRLIHVGVVARNGGVEEIFVVAIVAGDFGAADYDVADLTLIGVVEQLSETDVLFLTSAGYGEANPHSKVDA